MRPGFHLSNCSPITPADEDIVRRWAPLSALLAMNNIAEDEAEIGKLIRLWEIGGNPLLILRKYFEPEYGNKPNRWGIHAMETVIMARRCMARGVPAKKIALKPFNEPNMPTWACNAPYGEGFGDQPEHIERYGRALATFIDVAKNEEPDILIGGPHLTVGNHDVRFPNDPEGRYYYGPDSLCQWALDKLDLHFVHCYGFERGQYRDRAHGLRFLEYEKFLPGKPIYIVEGMYGEKWENGNSIDPSHNNVRGEDTVAYLRLLDQYSQVKGITLWIGGNTGWDTHRHSDGWDAGTHRPVVFYVEDYVKGESPTPPPEPPIPPTPPTPPEPAPEVKMRAYLKDGTEVEPASLLGAYAVTIEPCSGAGFRVVEARERCEAANCDIWVKGQGGELLPYREVRWGWPGTEVTQSTGPDGRVGFAMAKSAYYDPAVGGGPHWTAVAGNSETVRGIGMIPGTVHCTLGYTFQYLEGAPQPPPEPPTPPEPEPQPPTPPAPLYEFGSALNARLVAAGLGFLVDVRGEIERKYARLAECGKRSVDAKDRVAGFWSITLHHDAIKGPLNVMAIAKNHTDPKPSGRGFPHIAYCFVINTDGTVWWTKRLKWYGPHAGNARFNKYSIAVAVHGDFTVESPTEPQLKALRAVVETIEEWVGEAQGKPQPLPIVRHKDIVNTECPGSLYEKYREYLDK